MEIYKIENLKFRYPFSKKNALNGISLEIKKGEFLVLCGQSGCGKSTFLRQLKPALSPHGEKQGSIIFNGKSIEQTDFEEQSRKIGFIMQNPDNQIVTDKVWHELAFGLESIGEENSRIRMKVAEMASFFGIQNWFHKNVNELSGGQKQLLSLASVMVMQPEVILLDEPTGQLDPIAAHEFLQILSRINKEFGTTIILSEHRLDEAFAVADRVAVMDDGKIIICDTSRKTGEILKETNHKMRYALPVPMQIYSHVPSNESCPVTVREGREWLEKTVEGKELKAVTHKDKTYLSDAVIKVSDVFFRYEKNQPDILKKFSLTVNRGELYAIMGANGSGKTTALSVIGGLMKPYRGSVKLACNMKIGILPQDPSSVFVKNTVISDLYDIFDGNNITKDEADARINEVCSICKLEDIKDAHPYDISGGEQQRCALAKVLLTGPQMLLLDEPTKGLDADFKRTLSLILNRLKKSGTTIIMVSHDIEFCAQYADRCGMFFDGNIVSEGEPREFFASKSFYTTAASRMSRGIIPDAVLNSDIIEALGGEAEEENGDIDDSGECTPPDIKAEKSTSEKRLSKKKIAWGTVFMAFFLILGIASYKVENGFYEILMKISALFSLALGLNCFIVQRPISAEHRKRTINKSKMLVAVFFILFLIPLTIYFGMYFLENRKYYFTALLIVIETFIPFFVLFEKRKPKARELVTVSVLCAIAVAGRGAFYMLPEFKPVMAIIIISGVCLGAETGFLVGAMTGFVSNFFFGQGPWTPWQMFAMGITGFIAGILFSGRTNTKGALCIYGAVASVVLYGAIMNIASVLMVQSYPSAEAVLTAFMTGLPFDIVRACATAVFLYFGAEPFIEKLDRIKIKYGFLQ